MIRSFGVENLQNQIREHIRLGQVMTKILQKDLRFEVCNKVVMGLICFRAKSNDMFNKALLYRCNETGNVSLASCVLQNKFVIRMCINSPKCSEEDLDSAYKLICNEYDILKPFQYRIEVMNQAELETFIRDPAKIHSSAEVSRRFPVVNPLEPCRSLAQISSQMHTAEYAGSLFFPNSLNSNKIISDPPGKSNKSPQVAAKGELPSAAPPSSRTPNSDISEKSDR